MKKLLTSLVLLSLLFATGCGSFPRAERTFARQAAMELRHDWRTYQHVKNGHWEVARNFLYSTADWLEREGKPEAAHMLRQQAADLGYARDRHMPPE